MFRSGTPKSWSVAVGVTMKVMRFNESWDSNVKNNSWEEVTEWQKDLTRAEQTGKERGWLLAWKSRLIKWMWNDAWTATALMSTMKTLTKLNRDNKRRDKTCNRVKVTRQLKNTYYKKTPTTTQSRVQINAGKTWSIKQNFPMKTTSFNSRWSPV